MDLEGRILDGRYQLGSLLGVGGMARVYVATDRGRVPRSGGNEGVVVMLSDGAGAGR